MKPNIRFYETVGKLKSATVTIGKVKIYLHNIEWDNPRELWFTITCPELGIDPYAHVIYVKHKVLSCCVFGWDSNKEIKLPYENKISKKTYRDVIRKVFTSDYFKSKYFKIIANKTQDIEHEIIEMENKVVKLQEKIAKLRDIQSKLNNSQVTL